MSKDLVQKPDLTQTETRTLLVGLSSRSVLGFIYMWLHIGSFVWSTKKAKGCMETLPCVISPFSILLVSYWESQRAMLQFVGSPAHGRWMRFIHRFPGSLNLFNETYSQPLRANFINSPRGYARSLQRLSDAKEDLPSSVRTS